MRDRSGRVMVRLPEQADLVGVSLVGTPVVDTILHEGTGAPSADEAAKRSSSPSKASRSAQPGAAFVSTPCPRRKLWRPLRMRLATT